MASNVLAEKDSEFSDAYIFWFGEDNAKASTRTTIKQLNYDPVQDFLKAPGSRNRVDDLKMDNLSPTGLTYMCAAGDSDVCAGGMAAAAHQHGAGGLSGHSIILCERFFKANSQQDMLRTWKETRRLSAAAGFWLLHEVQHLGAIVSDSRRCIDVLDPNRSDGSGCYDANCCSRLKGADKIRNAQNMAFFALEVMADPESGAAPGQSCTIMKRDTGGILLGGPEDLMARADYSPDHVFEGMLRRQARSSSTLRTTWRNSTGSSISMVPSTRSTLLNTEKSSGSASPTRSSQQASLSQTPSTNNNPIFTTRPPVSVSSASGASFSISYSTSPPTTQDNGIPIVPIIPVPVPVPVAPVAPVPPVVPPVGGGGEGGGSGGDNGNNGDDSKASQTSPPKSSQPPSSPTSSSKPSPTSSPASLTISSATPCSSRPPLSVPSGGDASPDRDGLPQAVYDELAAEASSIRRSSTIVLSSTVSTAKVESSTTSILSATPTPSATAAPVACYNFDINAYGYCCPGPGNPCENDIGKCYFNGKGVSGGSSGVVPDGARCPPPEGAEYCRGPCEE
ncbi:alpha-tubulin suppressor and related Rcc1 domain-containing protein [Colletotrichum tofieldiae]|uniref:Alpha-tubulin suppressor and related Rcc1 domain-containing protein n=1 Tax=Colletotrichum tofieldiae TaxID=708197 RepID=A0A166W2D7_9PEZI|nr:alpha-tubulin suppressor and related Rcc1 domain-containing protein [Colletotrichum tofieldiae]